MKRCTIAVCIAAFVFSVSAQAAVSPLNPQATFQHRWNNSVFKTETADIGPGYDFICDYFIVFIFFPIKLYSYAVDVSEEGILVNFYFLNPMYLYWTFGGLFHGLTIEGLINEDALNSFQGVDNIVTTMDFNDRTAEDMFVFDPDANRMSFNWTRMTIHHGAYLKADFLFAAKKHPPLVDAGDNVRIPGREQHHTVICGTITDPDDDELTYRWLEDGVPLVEWADAGEEGQACLELGALPFRPAGEYLLTLEGFDGKESVLDDMVLIVDNSAPNVAPTGSGTYEIFTPVAIGGEVSDMDGDLLAYKWLKGSNVLFTGTVASIEGGDPVALPEHILHDLPLGLHTLMIGVHDGVNAPVIKDILVEIVDTTAPTLAPAPSKTILWPPNHKMVDIVIAVNASDNSGGPVMLAVEVMSNEPINDIGDGATSPDWTEPVITPDGFIQLQLRAERSGRGVGRVYTIVIYAADESGNTSRAEVEIIVPHNQSGGKN